MIETADPVSRARRLADEVLYPAASEVDRTGQIPADHFDRLAEQGLYGLRDGTVELAELCRVVETLASGCLSTTFVWLQHLGAVRAAMHAAVAPELVGGLRTGTVRSGVVQAALRPGPPSVRADVAAQGFQFTGTAPWVTGWGYVDVFRIAARTADDQLVWALIDANESESLAIEPTELSAVNASRTVELRLTGHLVPPDRVLSVQPWQPGDDPAALRVNGSLALGLIDRCIRGGAPPALERQLNSARDRLDAAVRDVNEVAEARAAAAELAVRAAAAAVVARGAPAVRPANEAGRWYREAMFLLVFGSRPPIRAELSRLFVDG